MSRCFPFPPPGYEKKARTDDADLLSKEKHKEKKHKKEKDKEKREGKEKKDKDRSKDKHKEKKDRKEKHKDKKKDKDRDKDKNKASDEKRNEGRIDSCNGELRENNHQAEGLKDSELMEELGRRIRDEATGTGNQMVQNFIGTDQRRNEGNGRAMEKETEKRTEGKDKSKDKDKQGDDRRAEKQRHRDEQRVSSNEMVRNINDTDQRRVEGNIPTEKKVEKRIEGKEKINKDKGDDDRRGERHKNRECKEKRSKGKDKDRDKEKKKEEEKVKEHGNHKHNKEQDKVRESGRAEHIGNALNIKPSYPPKDSEKSALGKGNLKKRKELETNGFIHENEMRPNKLSRPASSSLVHCENGRKLESCHISDRQGANDSRKVEIQKEHKVNGIVEAQPSSVVPRPSVSIGGSENGEACTRSPHPDSKYLSQILSVPKMEEWSDFDNQEWLFGGNDLWFKPMAAASDASETQQVWAEALQIESADVYGLPYVIPY